MSDKIAKIKVRHDVVKHSGIVQHLGIPSGRLWNDLRDAHRDRGFLLAEVERLRTGLHLISLASQNSMSNKEECGKIAREILKGAP